MSAADRWRAELAAWAIPAEILAVATRSPYSFPVGMFSAAQDPIDSPSRARALDALPAGGSVLDVGCGGGAGAFALVPPAGSVVGVDQSPRMLAAFAATAAERGVPHREVEGSWPGVAVQAETADVAIAHHVAYNVADLGGFAAALEDAARHRVVLEVTDVHPWVPMRSLWWHFHRLERPSGPSAELAAEVLTEAGFAVHVQRWSRPARRIDRAQAVAFTCQRLCLPPEAEPEVDAVLPLDQTRNRELVTLWWDPSP